MLAILPCSNQFLHVGLTFGPTNGPKDFAYATDRIFAPGVRLKMRLCKEWEIYADDCTIRTGRWIDGIYPSVKEDDARLKEAMRTVGPDKQQGVDSALKAVGVDTQGLGKEKAETRNEEREECYR